MAEIALSAFLTVVFEKLTSEALKEVARSKGIGYELEKLKDSLDQIHDLLNDAAKKEIADAAVKRWLNDLQHLAYDIDDLLDSLATKAIERELTKESGATTSKVRNLIPTCCTSFSQTTKLHRKLDDISIKLKDLLEGKRNPGLSVIPNEKPKNKKDEAPTVDTVVGREGDKKALLQKLLGGKDESRDENFSIVPIVGMGGVGKTTLAKLLYDDKEVNDHFEVKAWVCVSDEFDVSDICKVIYKYVTKEDPKFANLNELQDALKEKLKNKLFFIVLDDVWSENYVDWQKLAGPFREGAHGSKIVITTRKVELLRQLGYADIDSLQSLSNDDALSLFAQHALGVDSFDSHPTLRAYGVGIVEKCGGLPLALTMLGRLLRNKDEEEWKVLLNSEIWRLGKTDSILPALKLSYNDLSAILKQLFAYCSLFPKDYVFDKKEVILLWMAEGFLHQSTISMSMNCWDWGNQCFKDLQSKSFFQHAPDDKSLFVMHDLINDLAMFVAGEFFSRSDIEMKKEIRKEAFEICRHMSFVCEYHMVSKRFEPFKRAKSLRTFLAVPSVGVIESWQQFHLSNKVLNDLLCELPLLRVLSLSRLSISEVPEFVGSMKHLRYLNLSHTRIKHLPENVGNLYNLQTLIVSGCDELIRLPKSFSNLKNLQHFDIRDTPLLKKLPVGIGELKSLRTLSKIIVGGKNDFAITELKNLHNLHGQFSISGLGNVQNAMDAREANLSQKQLNKLELDWSRVSDSSQVEAHDKEVLNELKPDYDSLKKLEIMSYRGTEFPNWVGDLLFHRLTHVRIDGCEECTSLPRLGELPSLKKLFISKMSKVKVVGLELLGTGDAFPSLEILSFKNMEGWEEWSTKSGVGDASFPCLEELRIKRCPNLVDVSLEALHSLRVLKLSECGHGVLTSLVDVASSVTKLKMDHITMLMDDLWRGVIEHLGAVEEVIIKRCNEIRYLWESEAEASKFLVNIRELVISNCSKLVSLGEKEVEDNCGSNLTSLRSLEVWNCSNLKHCCCPNSIELLRISGCDSVTSVSFPTGGGQKLKSLWIFGCEKLMDKELGGGEKTGVIINSSMPMLERVVIHAWPNMKSITELGYFIHLTRLEIVQCPSMESFPDHELPSLTSLTDLEIRYCPSMDASFPRGLWPPKLCSLAIGGLKKPLSEWGQQYLPTSLVELRLDGGPHDDGVSNFDQLSHLLPSSLTSLHICGFEKLESVSVGLQHLTSLQHLSISNCPKTRDLPENLLFSLLSLSIYGCPNLKQRSSRGGSYWPSVSLIPSVTIDLVNLV